MEGVVTKEETYAAEKSVQFVPKKEKSKAFSDAHSNLETFFKRNGKKPKGSPDISPNGSPKYSPRPERRPSAPKIDIKARTKFCSPSYFKRNPKSANKEDIQKVDETHRREPPAPPPPVRKLEPPKAVLHLL